MSDYGDSGGVAFLTIKTKYMTEVCEHVEANDLEIARRGANATSRWIRCRACETVVISARRVDGVGLWRCFMLVLLYLGPRGRGTANPKVALMCSTPRTSLITAGVGALPGTASSSTTMGSCAKAKAKDDERESYDPTMLNKGSKLVVLGRLRSSTTTTWR